MIRPFIVGFATTLKHIFKKPITVNYPDQKIPVFRVARQTGPDARRVRAREMRRLRPVLGRLSGRRHLPRRRRTTARSRPAPATRRSTRSTRRAASSAACVKRPVPYRPSSWARLRDRRLQQQGFHLGQGRPARPGADFKISGGLVRERPTTSVHIFGALGDIHGDFSAARQVMERHPEVPFWLCVGDVADADGNYERFPAPLYWIKGNNENFDAIAAGVFPESTCSTFQTAN